ncbi:S8 family peptidase [Bradyrhizobium sp. Tv2a-2]|uniref:S8 family peptidase n=1 Tax=Bradyrhizobium sp. Tv2a-2 TaxID=113395 RepID=UPI0018DD2CFD|nr:S8 family peptidase [Bradyrhizobium sp. Tv2a-2]
MALAAADALRPTDTRLEPASSSVIEVELRKGTAADVLDMKTEGIRAGAAREDEARRTTIALHVPNNARPLLEQIISDYLTGPLTERGQNPPNKAKVEAIENIRVARIGTLWTDARPVPEGAQVDMWWALWCYRDKEAVIEDVCARLEVRTGDGDRRLYFHEVVVVPVLANRVTIELLMFATDAIAELRIADDSPTFFTDDIRGDEQAWVDALAERVIWPGNYAPAVCVLDTGINRGHPLIEPALGINDGFAINPDWGTDDHDADGHGTAMAGLALHGDLTAALADTEERFLLHRLESVKILPPAGFDPSEPQSYGILTQAGLVLPEIEAPERKRAYCLAVTNDNVSGATASSWSAAIDQAAAGCMVADGGEDERPRRLIVVSAGNVPAETTFALVEPQDNYPIEDPAQAWNALTVGGYTDLIAVRDDGYTDWTPMVAAGEVSPHSRTSVTWQQGIAPFKPELVFEAGNRAIDPRQTEVLTMGSLSLLTTGRDPVLPLVPFEATSAAAAQGARMAARLMASNPDFWPETIRALMVHSAEWTPAMLAAIDATPSKRERYQLIRRFGYGVPDFDRANASAINHLAMIAQSEIQPFQVRGNRKFNECHYYNLPIPGDMLEELENEPVELKVTLSYFIDPNPGLSANVDSQRYQSYGLRFDLQRPRETFTQFKTRVNASERANPRRRGTPVPADTRWVLGQDSVSAGSLHCDVWRGPAIELLGRTMLCVKPVNGWWRDRSSPDVCNRQTRYALIVSLRTRNLELDIHTPITVAAATVPVEVETEV